MKLHSPPWKPILGICLVFILGGITGLLVDRVLVARKMQRFMQDGPAMITEVLQRRLTYDLSLDQDQQTKLHGILSDATQHIKQARQQIQPQVRDILLDAQQKTEAILRPEQVERFHQDLTRAQQRFGHRLFSGEETAPATKH